MGKALALLGLMSLAACSSIPTERLVNRSLANICKTMDCSYYRAASPQSVDVNVTVKKD